jgi:mRNA interferase YafQ
MQAHDTRRNYGGTAWMSFVLLRSSAFMRNARKIIKKQPDLAANIQEVLELLAVDAFQPSLRTHKLKGELKDSYACSAGYDLRIIFKFVEHEEVPAILLESIGTHDEVY